RVGPTVLDAADPREVAGKRHHDVVDLGLAGDGIQLARDPVLQLRWRTHGAVVVEPLLHRPKALEMSLELEAIALRHAVERALEVADGQVDDASSLRLEPLELLLRRRVLGYARKEEVERRDRVLLGRQRLGRSGVDHAVAVEGFTRSHA